MDVVTLVTVAEMRQIEAEAVYNGISYDEMMIRAGQITADYALHMLKGIPSPKITLLIGKGNNGGDGLVAARALMPYADVRCYLLQEPNQPYTPFDSAKEAEVFMAFAEHDDGRVLRNMIASSDLIIDALFGIGIRLPLNDVASRVLKTVRQVLNEHRRDIPNHYLLHPQNPTQQGKRHYPRILAVDCPSGMDCDTGEIDSNALPADATLTFIHPKLGQVIFPAANFVGELVVAPLGLPDSLPTRKTLTHHLTTSLDVAKMLPIRPHNSNKGTFGKTLVIGGSVDYIGAPALSAEAAYRTGAGWVSLASVQPVTDRISSTFYEPTYITLPAYRGGIAPNGVDALQGSINNYNTVLVGPGLGLTSGTSVFLVALLNMDCPPLVLDADALNVLSGQSGWWNLLPPQTIITPHPGEMSRLTGLSIAEIQGNRLAIAQEYANTWKVTLVLKGAHTLIASPNEETYILPFKSDALATAGTGDVLAGIIAGFRTQGISAHHAAVIGAYLHGLCGEVATQQLGSSRGVIAGDVLKAIPHALSIIEAT
jgi:hydroxyethylthiazole kinase-like uncharacterized protein yjeF